MAPEVELVIPLANEAGDVFHVVRRRLGIDVVESDDPEKVRAYNEARAAAAALTAAKACDRGCSRSNAELLVDVLEVFPHRQR